MPRLEFGEFFDEAGGEDGEAAPGFGVEILIIEVEADGVAFALPLVAAPEFEEFDGPAFELFFGIFRVKDADDFEDVLGPFFVANGGPLYGVEDGVGHEVGFVGLLISLGSEFGGGVLEIDD